MPLVRAIARDAARENYRFSTVVLGIVEERAVHDEEGRGRSSQATTARKHVQLRADTG